MTTKRTPNLEGIPWLSERALDVLTSEKQLEFLQALLLDPKCRAHAVKVPEALAGYFESSEKFRKFLITEVYPQLLKTETKPVRLAERYIAPSLQPRRIGAMFTQGILIPGMMDVRKAILALIMKGWPSQPDAQDCFAFLCKAYTEYGEEEQAKSIWDIAVANPLGPMSLNELTSRLQEERVDDGELHSTIENLFRGVLQLNQSASNWPLEDSFLAWLKQPKIPDAILTIFLLAYIRMKSPGEALQGIMGVSHT